MFIKFMMLQSHVPVAVQTLVALLTYLSGDYVDGVIGFKNLGRLTFLLLVTYEV